MNINYNNDLISPKPVTGYDTCSPRVTCCMTRATCVVSSKPVTGHALPGPLHLTDPAPVQSTA